MAWNIRTSRVITPDLEILVHQVNVDVAPSIVLDASTFPLNSAGERELKAGTPLVKNENNQYQAFNGVSAQRAQRVNVVGTGGSFTLTHSAQTTGALAFSGGNAPSAATVETALEALSTISDVDVQRTGAGTVANPYVYAITFNVEAEAAAITGTSSLTGPGAALTASTAGSTGILGILVRTERVPDQTAKSDIPSAMWNHGQWFRADRIVGWATDQAAIRAALPTCKFS
jgi:hypothetical protein